MASDGMGNGRAHNIGIPGDLCSMTMAKQQRGIGSNGSVLKDSTRHMLEHPGEYEVMTGADGTPHPIHRDLAVKYREAENRGFDAGWTAAIEQNYDVIWSAGAQAAIEQLNSEHGDDQGAQRRRPGTRPAA